MQLPIGLVLQIRYAHWAAIDRRTTGLVAAPLVHRRRNRLVLAGFALAFGFVAVTWLSALAPLCARHTGVNRH
ncbi:MAG: hypothetical protein ABIY55_15240 [Kofleriaceae bacterium]